MATAVAELIERIHAAQGRIVLAVSGGGSRALAELFAVAGASRTMFEAVAPYSEAATTAWLGGRPDRFCAPETARAMAVIAFGRAYTYAGGKTELAIAGIASSAALTSDRPKRGAHRAHLATQTAARTVQWSIELAKGRRSRAEEEQLVTRLLLNLVAETVGADDRLDVELLEGEHVERQCADAPQDWQNLLLGKIEVVACGGAGRPADAVFSGAFNPLHTGHRRMIEIAESVLGVPVAMEISIVNVDKPPLDYLEIEQRLRQFDEDRTVWLTRAKTFEEKSRLFPGATFIVGTDTLRRIADPHYHAGSPAAHAAALERIAERRCGFLVFGRDMGTGFVRLSDLELPEILRSICQEVPISTFREDVSSTRIRRDRD